MWPSVTPRGVIDSQLAELMGEMETTAKKAAGSPGENVVLDYRDWAASALWRLRPQFSDAALDNIVRTRVYWALIPFAPASAMEIQLMRSELDEAAARFASLNEEYRRFAACWSGASLIAVLDTSAIMGVTSAETPEALTTSNWFALLSAALDDPLRLVVPLVVVDELDNLKDRGPTKEAKTSARLALRTLESLLDGDERVDLPSMGSGSATLEAFIDPPEHRRIDNRDDEIVAEAALLRTMTNQETVVATRDTGMLMRARHAGITGRRTEPL